MSDELVIVPSNGDGYVELARTKTGRLFRKHILNKGSLLHPTTGEQIVIDDIFVNKLTKNFNDGVCDIVQVPLANDKNEHTEDPARNIGEVIGIETKDDKVYVVVDARDGAYADKLGKTLLGASAMMHLDYTDTKTGQKVGPTLLHACVTNRPYVTGLENYEEIVAATSDSSEGAVLLTDNTLVVEDTATEETKVADDTAKTPETASPSSLEELLTVLKTEHGVDVAALQAKASEGDQAAKLSQTIVAALADAGVVKLTNTDDAKVSTEDVVGAVSELAGTNLMLTNRVNALEKRDAEHAVDTLIAEGRVMPAQRDAFVELKLTNAAMFSALVPAEPIIKLNDEAGKTPPNDDAHKVDVDQEIARLSAQINERVKAK